jgi:hypothetical protein
MSVQQRLKFDDSVFFRSPSETERRHMKRAVSLTSTVVGSRTKLPRFDPNDSELTTPGDSSRARKHYPSFEEFDALKQVRRRFTNF